MNHAGKTRGYVRQLNRFLWSTLITGLVLLAVYVSLGRYFIVHLNRYQDQITGQLQAIIGLQVSADQISGRWVKLSPVVVFDNLKLTVPEPSGQVVLSLRHLEVHINVLGSLLRQQLLVHGGEVDGLVTEVVEDESGAWQLAGFAGRDETAAPEKLVDMLLSLSRASVNEVNVLMRYNDAPASLMRARSVSLQRSGDFRRVRLQLGFNTSEQFLDIILEANGDPRTKSVFSAKAFVQLDNIDFADHLPTIKRFGINLNYAEIDGAAWIDWRPNRKITVQGKLQIPGLDLAGVSGREMPPLDNVEINFRAEKLALDRWKIWLPHVRGEVDGLLVEQNNSLLDVSPRRLIWRVPSVDIAMLTDAVSRSSLLDEHGNSILSDLSPSGELGNARLTLVFKKPSFKLQAQLIDVSVLPWKGTPGATGINGYLELNNNKGRVDLRSDAISLQFPGLFDADLDYRHAEGQIRWQVVDRRLLLSSGAIDVLADHGAGVARVSLDIPFDKQLTPRMNLEVGIGAVDVEVRKHYIPNNLSESLRHWLDRSIVAGRISHGGFIYRGSLLKDDSLERTAQLYFDVKEGTLDYQERWPRLEQLNAAVVIDDGNVFVTSEQAQLAGLQTQDASVRVVHDARGFSRLAVAARAYGPTAGGLDLLRHSPIRDAIGGSFDNWHTTGDVQAQVALDIPLDSNDPLAQKIDVQAELIDTNIQVPEYRLDFSGINGPLRYRSEKGLSSAGLTGSFLGQTVSATLTGKPAEPVYIDFSGDVEMDRLTEWLRQPGLGIVSGKTNFKGRVSIPGGEPGNLSVQSSLEGVAIDVPAPFGKLASESRPFSVSMPMGKVDATIAVSLENLAHAQFSMVSGTLDGAQIHLGSGVIPATPLMAGSLVVSGELDTFNLSLWQSFYEKLREHNGGVKNVPSELSLPIVIRQLRLHHFVGFDREFDNLLISAEQRFSSWYFSIAGPVFDGTLEWFSGNEQPHQLALRYLHLPDTESDGINSMDPSSFPAMDIAIDDLTLGDQAVGAIGFALRPIADGAAFRQITATLGELVLLEKDDNSLEWRKTGDSYNSAVKATAHFKNLSDVYTYWGYQPVVDSSDGEVKVDLSWPESPSEWSTLVSRGDIFISLKKGRLLNTSSGSEGALKVVSILNLTNILRRLQLDFRDLYRSGISFDQIDGHVRFDNGVMTIVDKLTIKSPSSSFTLSGRSDLKQEALNMELVTTIPVANNLPLIVAATGNIPGAVATYVASKIFQKQVDSFSSLVYSVTGSWKEPQLQLKKIFDDELSGKAIDRNTIEQATEQESQ